MMIYLYLDMQGSTSTPITDLQQAWGKTVSDFFTQHGIEPHDVLNPDGDPRETIDCDVCIPLH